MSQVLLFHTRSLIRGSSVPDTQFDLSPQKPVPRAMSWGRGVGNDRNTYLLLVVMGDSRAALVRLSARRRRSDGSVEYILKMDEVSLPHGAFLMASLLRRTQVRGRSNVCLRFGSNISFSFPCESGGSGGSLQLRVALLKAPTIHLALQILLNFCHLCHLYAQF